jgi:hypothetical protein
MPRTLEGRIAEVLIGTAPPLHDLAAKRASPDAAYLVTTPVPEVAVTLEGFAGDRHAGFTRRADNRTPFYPRGTVIGNSRQVSLVSVEELAQLAAALGVPRVAGAWLGANLVVAGCRASRRSCRRRGSSSQTTRPCWSRRRTSPAPSPARRSSGATPTCRGWRAPSRRARELRGLVAWVERPGTIRAGDPVRVAVAEPAPYGGVPRG